MLVSSAAAVATGWRLRGRRVAIRILAAAGGAVASACVLWALIVGLVVTALFEPWPLSRRQGPDTVFSRECYAEFLGEAPPADVTQVYCRKEWGFGGDSISTIRFAFGATATIDAIVERLELEVVPVSGLDRVRYLNAPGWWPARDRLSRVRDVYQRRNIEFLWVDRESMEAFYQHAQF